MFEWNWCVCSSLHKFSFLIHSFIFSLSNLLTGRAGNDGLRLTFLIACEHKEIVFCTLAPPDWIVTGRVRSDTSLLKLTTVLTAAAFGVGMSPWLKPELSFKRSLLQSSAHTHTVIIDITFSQMSKDCRGRFKSRRLAWCIIPKWLARRFLI